MRIIGMISADWRGRWSDVAGVLGRDGSRGFACAWIFRAGFCLDWIRQEVSPCWVYVGLLEGISWWLFASWIFLVSWFLWRISSSPSFPHFFCGSFKIPCAIGEVGLLFLLHTLDGFGRIYMHPFLPVLILLRSVFTNITIFQKQLRFLS